MNDGYKLIIPGTPIAKGRPRVGKFGTYTPNKTVNYENLVQLCYMDQVEGQLLTGPVALSIEFYFPIPKSISKKDKAKMQTGDIMHTKKPDIDNCIKSITDALNGFAYRDDSQVVLVQAYKLYADDPRVEVTIKGVD